MISSSSATKTEIISSEIKNQLRHNAILKFGVILPVNNTVSIYDEKCYSVENKDNEKFIIYWFNDVSGSTHIEYIKISNN